MAAKAAKREEADIPLEYLGDYIARSSVAMEQIALVVNRQEEWMKTQWPQLVDTLNSDFLIHNQRTEMLCKAIDESNKQMMEFRTGVWNQMWTLFQRIMMVAIGVISAIAGWRIIDGL